MTEAVEPRVVETRKDVQTRQVKGGHVIILTTRTLYDNGANSTAQDDAVAETGDKASAIIAAFLAPPAA